MNIKIIFPDTIFFTEGDKEEYHESMNQAIGNLILQNWMEMNKKIVDYLCNCWTSPF